MSEITAHSGLFRNTDLHVDDTGGTGRPVVLIHGWPLSGQSWQAQVPVLDSAGYRVITYDRRGFGRSDKPGRGYDYDTLTEDLYTLLEALDVYDATLVGFSMGGGEVARYFTAYGPERVHSAVFAASVTPYLMHADDNPDGPLTAAAADEMAEKLDRDQASFYEEFTKQFFSANGELKVTEAQRRQALAMTVQADHKAALGCMEAWAQTDFRPDLAKVSVPALVLHGDADATVPHEGSAVRTHAALPDSRLHLIEGAPHGCNVSHAEEFNRALLGFLAG